MIKWPWELRVGIMCPTLTGLCILLLSEMTEVPGDELGTAWEEGFKGLDLPGFLYHICIRSETYHFLVEWRSTPEVLALWGFLYHPCSHYQSRLEEAKDSPTLVDHSSGFEEQW